MAREFDELESRRRPSAAAPDYLPYLQEMLLRRTPPRQNYMKEFKEDYDKTGVDKVDTFRDRFSPFDGDPIRDLILKQEERMRERGTPVQPGHRERFLDPTKVISDFGKNSDNQPYPGGLPPSLNKPMAAAKDRDWDVRKPPHLPIMPLEAPIVPWHLPIQGHEGHLPPPTGPMPKGRRGALDAPTQYAQAGGTTSDAGPQGRGLPEGFTAEPTPQGRALPKGFSAEPQGPAPTAGALAPEPGPVQLPASPTAGMSQWSEDPNEQAREMVALRTAPGAQPPEGRQEGAATAAIEAAPGVVGQEAKRLLGIMDEALKTGDLPPQQAVDLAMSVGPTAPAYRTYSAIRRAAVPVEGAARELGIRSIPRGAVGGETEQLTARGLSGLPVIGGPLRQAAAQTTDELMAAGTAAATRPTGVVPSQNLAGSNVRRGVERAAQTAIAAGNPVPRAFGQILGKSNEDIIGRIATMATEMKAGANINALVDLRRAVPTRDWPNVQGALIQRWGQSARTGEFDPATFVRNYGSLSNRARNVLFSGQAGLETRRHLDALFTVSQEAKRWQQFQRERSSIGTKAGVIGGIAGLIFDPIKTLGVLVPAHILSRALAKPSMSAPIVQFVKAHTRVLQTNGAPQAIASFTLATRNMNNSLGTDIDPSEALKGASDGEPME